MPEAVAMVSGRNSHDVRSSKMVVGEERELVLGNEASKRKFEDTITSWDGEYQLRVVDIGEI